MNEKIFNVKILINIEDVLPCDLAVIKSEIFNFRSEIPLLSKYLTRFAEFLYTKFWGVKKNFHFLNFTRWPKNYPKKIERLVASTLPIPTASLA